MARSAKKASSPLPPTPDQGDLLTEPLIGVADVRGARTLLTIPQVFARLSDPAASTVAFTALQAHQSHAWHAFLVQVAAMALHRTGERTPWTSPERWRQALVALADGSTSAWTLVVGDLSQPAFMQPPVPEGTLDGFGLAESFSAECDLPQTARNHDYKTRSFPADPQYWLFGLIAIQTAQGYSGATKYGVMRMNGAGGSRIGLGVANGCDLGGAFRRDVGILLDCRKEIADRIGFSQNGLPLLWCVSWTGADPKPVSSLDPLVIEVCRRLRLTAHDGIWQILKLGTDHERVQVQKRKDKGQQKWVVQNAHGDPWTPVDRKSGKAKTLGENGFTYEGTADLILSPDWEHPPTQQVRPADRGDLRWYGRTLVRGGQGKIGGWHEREVPIPERLRSRFAAADERDKLAQTAKTMVQLSGVMRLGILKPALRALWDSECNRTRKDASSTADAMIQKGLARLEAAIDAAFFEHLWDHPDDADPWRQRLATFAQAILDADCGRVGPAVDRWRRIAKAESVFKNRIHFREHPPFGLFSPLPDSIRSPSHDD